MESAPVSLNDSIANSMAAMGARSHKYAQKSLSQATHMAYESDWSQFTAWCEEHNLCSMPAAVETIVLWLSETADRYRPSTLERKAASISKVHQFTGHKSPTCNPMVRTILTGIRRHKRECGEPVLPERKAPILARHLRAMVEVIPDTLLGSRDKALLLIGYAGGFRRSEVSNLETRDLEFRQEGVLIRLRHSKTNQDGSEDEVKDIGHGRNAITCPVLSLRAWLEAANINEGPVFRPIARNGNPRRRNLSGGAIARIVKRYAAKIGLDDSRIGGHSLRAGFVTDQIDKGTPTAVIMRMTGHKSERVLNGYYRKARLFDRNLTAIAGL